MCLWHGRTLSHLPGHAQMYTCHCPKSTTSYYAHHATKPASTCGASGNRLRGLGILLYGDPIGFVRDHGIQPQAHAAMQGWAVISWSPQTRKGHTHTHTHTHTHIHTHTHTHTPPPPQVGQLGAVNILKLRHPDRADQAACRRRLVASWPRLCSPASSGFP